MNLTLIRVRAVLCSMLLLAQRPYIVLAQQPPPSAPAPQGGLLSANQMDSLVAPVALYPDPVLSQTLVASTYPLEIAEAARWMSQRLQILRPEAEIHSNLQEAQVVSAAAQQPWDASVQALVAFPDLLKRLNQNISWTTALGDA